MTFIKHSSLLFVSMLIFMFFVKAAGTVTKNLDQLKKQNAENMKKKRIVFLITKDPDNYYADETIPSFAEMLKKEYGYDVIVLLASGGNGFYHYQDMEMVSKADLLIIFARRIALPHEQMDIIKKYLGKGKPIIGIRTANHAFTVRDKIAEGFEDWPEFVDNILGCENRGYGPTEPGTDVSVVSEKINHPIVKDINPKQWHSDGNVYLVSPLHDKKADILLTGKVNGIIEPIAWTRTAGKSKVFYTSLGYPTDFKTPPFNTLFVNAIKWALD